MPTDPEIRDEVIATVRRFVARDVIPVASDLEHADEYPGAIVEQMKELGLFGITIPEEYGGLGLDLLTYIGIVEELSYGWMSLSGIINTHTMCATNIARFGTEAQRQRWLPVLASGAQRGALSLSEPDAGTDTRNISCRVTREGDEWIVNGTKTWVTNGERADPLIGARRQQDQRVRRREGAGAALGRRHGVEEHRKARLQGSRDRRDVVCRPPHARGRVAG